MLRKQNESRSEGAPFENQLKFDTVRELLKQTTGAAEMQRVLAKMDTNLDARISFEEF